MAASRTVNSLRNVFAAWGGQAIYAVGMFAVRYFFVMKLSQEYVGLESLFASILTILSLADLGIGSAIVFALYDPLARGDKEQVKSLMRLFKRCYITIGAVILLIGLILTPNIDLLIGKDAPDIPNLKIYFYCFVANTGVSYFFSYKGSLIMADQKNYVVYLVQYGFRILMCIAQIIVLLSTSNYLLYLICMVSATFIQNAVLACVANKMYPYLKEKDIKPVDKEVLSGIKKNIFGLMLHKFAGAASTPVLNLIITNFVSLAAISLYGNYLLVIDSLTNIIAKIFDSVIASVGNLGVTSANERQIEVFKTTLFINALIFCVVSSGLVCCFNPFIAWLFGEEWEFPVMTVVLIVFLFYVRGMRSAGQTFTSAYGLYWYTRWKAVLETIFLPLLALALVFPFGINGVLAAGIVSSLAVSTVYEGWAVCRHGIGYPLHRYCLRFSIYLITAVPIGAASLFVARFIPWSGIIGFLATGFTGVIVSCALFLVLFGRTRECKEAFGIVKGLLGKIVKKKEAK